MKLNVRMPHNTGEVGEAGEAEVIERPSLSGGSEPVWQAEITIFQGTTNHAGARRSFIVRAPPRKVKDQAEEDAKMLNNTAPQGAKAVRTLANQLHRSGNVS